MNIKLEHTHDGKWVVIVNSISGSVREDVTAQIHEAMHTEVWAEAQARADAELKRKTQEMQEAISGAIQALSPFIDE